MANVKNFGLTGVADNVQYGKAGPKLKHTAGTFQFRNATDAGDAALTAAGITSSAGNVTLTTGNLVLSSNAGVVTLGDAGSISRAATGVFQMSGTGAVIVPSGAAAARPTAATTAGGFRYNTETTTMEYSNGTAWTTLATGGTAVTAVSVASANGFAGTSSGGTTPELTLTTSVTGLLKGDGTAISTVVSGTDIKTVGGVSLLGAGDVGVIGAAYGGTGVDNGTDTINTTGNVSFGDLFTTTTDAITLNAASGGSNVTLPTSGTLATVGNTVASFSGGTTGLTPVSATTGAVTLGGTLVSANGGTGLSSFVDGAVLYASAADTWAAAVPGATSGVQQWSDELDAVAALSANGYAIRTGDGTWRVGSIEGTVGNISVADGAGAANTIINLATVGTAVTDQFVKVTTDAFGRVTATTAVATGDLTPLLDATYVNVSGDTMASAANLTFVGGGEVLGLPAIPSGPTAAASKAYVDAVAEGLAIKPAVELVTTSTAQTGAFTYDNGTLGVGATLTANANGAFPTIDGVTISSILPGENGVLVAFDGATGNLVNGRYNLTTVGTAGTPWVLTRCSLCDESDEIAGSYTFVKQGTAYAGSGWVQTWFGGASGTIGTTAIVVTQFSGAGSYSAGTGLTLTGTVFSANLGAGIGALPTNEIGIELFDSITGAIILTTDGTTRSTASGSQLQLLVPAGSSLTQDATGLYIGAGQVGNSKLTNSVITVTGTTGSDDVALGESLAIIGDSGAITTAMGANSLAVSARLATTTLTGVASFSVDNFDVTAGVVTVKAGGIDLTSEVTGILPGTNGGTGVNNGANTITLGGNLTTTGAFTSEFIMTGATSVTFPTSGTLLSSDNIASNAVTSFQTSLSGLTPSTAANGVVTLAGTLGVASGGTGVTTLGANEVMIGNGTGAVLTSSALTFASGLLTVGGAAPITIDGATGTIASTATNGDINLVPNGTGAVVIGPAGAGVISADAGEALTVTGNNTLVLSSTAGDIVMTLAASTADKVTVAGPTPTEYATGLADADLANKYYVDQVALTGGAGDVKAVRATFSLSANGTFNIGAALPAGATVLSVKANVTSADTGTGTLSVGKAGNVAAYMTTGENDTQTVGMYLAETMVTEAGSEQVIGTVAGGSAGAGSVTVVVTYQLA